MMTVRERFPQILLILQLPNTAQCCMQPAPLTGAQPEAAVESLWCPIPGVLEFMRSRDDAVPMLFHVHRELQLEEAASRLLGHVCES